MATLLSRLSGAKKSAPIEPREIFMALPQKEKGYEYPRDVQSQVWKKWFDTRNDKNCIIKMNTGSGKTVVGLMILQSCLNEGKGPAVYVVPDNYLAVQVCEEAKRIGILAVTDKDDYSYTENRAILVTTIYALVNGHSVFGMRPTNNYPIGSILLDDVHACMEKITTQFSIKIPSQHCLYSELIALFADQWKEYHKSSYTNIVEIPDPSAKAIIPFWMWQEKQNEIYSLLAKNNNDDENNRCIYFNFPLIENSLPTCDCYITTRSIEIVPEGISISQIKNFHNAQRRIFMSATLADDSVFASAIGLHKEDVRTVITPDSANDIGDRLILFPRHLNSAITDDEIKDKVISISESHNVVVIVPSFERAKYWDPSGARIINRENIDKFVLALKSGHVGFVVLVNRYDGIDLPDDACRLLVIDGLPPLISEKDKYIQSVDPASTILKKEQIQRIEQGMGRGVRSNSDSCCIVLMGDNLADVLLRNQGVSYFSNATREQYDLSKELWDLLRQENPQPSVDDVFELAYFSLNREVEWIQKSKEKLSEIRYASEPRFDNNALALRSAFDWTMALQWQKAISILDQAVFQEKQDSTKGYLLQIIAKYTNIFDRSKAQQILLSGKTKNLSILSPLSGIRYDKAVNNIAQAKAICEYIEKEQIKQSDYIIHVNALMSSLVFSPDSDIFERTLKTVGQLIGFISTRPDKETNGEGPDNLWAIGSNKYFVIECKTAAVAEKISKDYCNQLGGSIRWFSREYGDECTPIPVLVHKAFVIDRQATAVHDMRIITEERLERFKKSVNEFAIAISQNGNWKDEEKITRLLFEYKLRGNDIVEYYMKTFIEE